MASNIHSKVHEIEGFYLLYTSGKVASSGFRGKESACNGETQALIPGLGRSLKRKWQTQSRILALGNPTADRVILVAIVPVPQRETPPELLNNKLQITHTWEMM